MGTNIVGTGRVPLEVETNSRAARIAIRPIDWGALGSYSVGSTSGVIAAGLASSSEIFQFRYTAANLACVKRVLFQASVTGTGFTAGICTFLLQVGRSYSASGTGGTGLTLTTNNMKLRTSMATTGMGDIRIATTGALGAGTRTLDANPHAQIYTAVPVTASIQLIAQTALLDMRLGEYPLVLAQNEGFIITATVPATGTWSFSVITLWDELASF